MFAEVLRTVTEPRINPLVLQPLPPVRQTGPPPEEGGEHPLSEPAFVELAVADGTLKVWQIVRYDEPHLALVPAVIYLNGFSLVWDDAGMPAAFSDGEPVLPDTENVIIVSGPNVFGGVLICRADRPDAVAWVRHDQLLIEPRA